MSEKQEQSGRAGLVWFRNDLRVADQASLRRAIERESRPAPSLGVPEPIAAPLHDLPPVPTLESLGLEPYQPDPRSAFPFGGGATAAWGRIDGWMWSDHALATYRATRNELLGHSYSSELSPWLAMGCLSPRQVYWEVRRFEEEAVANKDTYWLIFELRWREYFKYVALKHGDAIFQGAGIRGQPRTTTAHRTAIEEWTSGRTGTPFVDANMVELNRTGFMSNRGGRPSAMTPREHTSSPGWARGLKAASLGST